MRLLKKQIQLVLLIILSALSGCKSNESNQAQQEPQEESPYVVDIEAVDYAFMMPSEIKSGWVTFRFRNTGHEMHFGQLWKFNSPLTADDFEAFMSNPNAETFEKYIKESPTGAGGPGFHSAGQESEFTFYLEPGNYGLLCNTSTAEGTAHRDLGMRKFIRVTEEASEGEQPEADLQLSLEKYQIKAEGQLESGRQTIAVEHTGGASFDVHMVKLNDSSTIPTAIQFLDDLQEPTSTLFKGGAEQKDMEGKSFVTIDLEPGNYMLTSQEFGAVGMYEEFSIPEEGAVEFEQETEGTAREMEVDVQEGAISMPQEIEAGLITFNYNNTEDEEHDVRMLRLEPEKSAEDYMKFLEGVRETQEAGEQVRVEDIPTLSYYVFLEEDIRLDLEPGTYFIACFQVEEGENEHLFNGEIQEFEVR